MNVRYAISACLGKDRGWLKVITDDTDTMILNVIGSNDPFEATVFADRIKVLEMIDKIERGSFNCRLLSDGVLGISTFFLSIEND